jgi:hypothetical protein
MRKYRGSHEDFDCFVVPTVPPLKQQQDTIATLVELARLGVEAARVRIVFNMVEDGVEITDAFEPLLAIIAENPIAQARLACRIGSNEIYGRLAAGLAASASDIAAIARDDTDYKRLIVGTHDVPKKLSLAQSLATRRLARGVLPELDACFAALALAD